MFADPLTLETVAPTGATIAATFQAAGSAAYSFVATGRSPLTSTYRHVNSATHYTDLTIGRQVGKRNRYTVRFTETELVPDPIDSSVNSLKTATLYAVADIGPLGTTTDWLKICHALSRFFYDSTDNHVLFSRVTGGET